MATTTIAPDLTTQQKENGGRIVLRVGGNAYVGLEGKSPERRIARLLKAAKASGIDVAKHKVSVPKSAPKNAVNVRGLTARDVFPTA
jgi:hypothetical protein